MLNLAIDALGWRLQGRGAEHAGNYAGLRWRSWPSVASGRFQSPDRIVLGASPGFHGGAFVVAYVEDTESREITTRDPFGVCASLEQSGADIALCDGAGSIPMR